MTPHASSRSPRKIYLSEVDEFLAQVPPSTGVYSDEDLVGLPESLQRYLRSCGYLGRPKVSAAEIVWEWSEIRLNPQRPWMKLKTYQHNFITRPARLAYMRAWMMGVIPFEGRDRYAGGQGHMFGALGRLIKIFDEREHEIGLGAAVIVLAEALLVPDYLFQEEYFSWEQVDARTVRGRLKQGEVDVSGTFHFNEAGEYVRFETGDRPYKKPDGEYERVPYSIMIDSYQDQGGVRIAREVRAIWHLEEGDYEYWRGRIEEVRFDPARMA